MLALTTLRRAAITTIVLSFVIYMVVGIVIIIIFVSGADEIMMFPIGILWAVGIFLFGLGLYGLRGCKKLRDDYQVAVDQAHIDGSGQGARITEYDRRRQALKRHVGNGVVLVCITEMPYGNESQFEEMECQLCLQFARLSLNTYRIHQPDIRELLKMGWRTTSNLAQLEEFANQVGAKYLVYLCYDAYENPPLGRGIAQIYGFQQRGTVANCLFHRGDGAVNKNTAQHLISAIRLAPAIIDRDPSDTKNAIQTIVEENTVTEDADTDKPEEEVTVEATVSDAPEPSPAPTN